MKCAAILLVEDDRDIREAVADFLEGEGFRVHQAENGAQALDTLHHMAQPVLILADLMMPVMDGASLIAALRTSDKFATLPVVLVTARTSDVPPGYRHVKKPIDLDDLVQIVDELCARSS